MNDKKGFYLTTTLPYVNAEPHIGFAMEIIQADIIARTKRLQGFDVFFNTGTDEHGQKIYTKALEVGMDTQKYADKYAETFKELATLLNLSQTHFIRTTSEEHKSSAQEMWRRCAEAGDIYKKNYEIKYCVGCELEKTDSELVDGCCPIHPEKDLEIREEENYFFKFSRFGPELLKLYGSGDFMVPDFRLNEIRALIDRSLEDFSISRLREKMPWGISVPDDEEHVMYVWFDALTSYISTLGWPSDKERFDKFWVNGTPVQFAGKDQVRQQAAMWQAMLLSAGLPPTRQIVIHGFINFDGQKMSKSLGNVLSPKELIDEYGVDALRYFIAREFNQFEDSDISVEKLRVAYNANLANGLGNLVSRVMKLAETNLEGTVEIDRSLHKTFEQHLDNFDIQKAINHIWVEIGELDGEIQESKPWETKDKEVIISLVKKLAHIGYSLEPFMPQTSEKIISAIKENRLSTPLFPRKD
ncbi:MAG: methionine--tRNA ligase [Parcubacteria group bacterium]